jgi:exodeoxyribonuclease-3
MKFTITTWNINSVRLRIDLVTKFLKTASPDVICLQETKCPDDKFPLKRFARLGYAHAALNGQKGYHGVAVLSRLPLDSIDARSYCGKSDSRHVAVKIGERAGLPDRVTLHNFYAPAGGDEPIRRLMRICSRSGPVGNQKSRLPSLLWVLFTGRIVGDACKA